jgi:mRNA-degrading endonuclease RelE of RelBE toxin-antitoxin system
MNKIDKFLLKLDKKTRLILEEIMVLIVSDNFLLLDIKKLKGSKNLYRVRVGRIRVVFEQTKNGNNISNISFRNDNTY